MKIKILKSCLVSGGHAEAGSTIEADRSIAVHLIQIGKASAAPEKPAPEKKPEKKPGKKKTPPAPPAEVTAE